MTICGTDEYMAPEMLFDESFSYPADMFSFGRFIVASTWLTKSQLFTICETTLLRLGAVHAYLIDMCVPLARAKLRLLCWYSLRKADVSPR